MGIHRGYASPLPLDKRYDIPETVQISNVDTCDMPFPLQFIKCYITKKQLFLMMTPTRDPLVGIPQLY